MVAHKKSRIAYWGESVREIGILLMVFGPMYLKFEARESAFNLLIDSSIWMICGIIFLVSGIELERKF